MKFYFYIKYNRDSPDLYKFGVTRNLIQRLFDDHSFFSHRSEYVHVFELDILDLYNLHDEPDKIISIIGRYPEYMDKLNLQYNLSYLKQLSTYLTSHIGGGTELIYKDGLETLLQFIRNDFPKLHIIPTELTVEKLKELHDKYMKKIELNNRTNLNLIIEQMNRMKQIIPNTHQQIVLDKIDSFYKKNTIGKLIWACGLGKALLGLFIIKLFNFKIVVIGVPSINLQEQMKNEIIKMYPNTSNILYVRGTTNDDTVNTSNLTEQIEQTTNVDRIKAFLNKPSTDCKFIITTYHSCHLLNDPDIKVDFKIGDEAHHLVGFQNESESKCTRQFTAFHRIKSTKTLFMTATEKTIDTNQTESETIIKYSMDDPAVFGNLIDSKSISWAIEQNKITDYNIIVLKNTESQIDYIISQLTIQITDRNLFLSAYMAIKSIELYEKLTHILVYTNTISDADLIQDYINSILDSAITSIDKEDIYNKSLHSKSDSKGFKNEVDAFKNSKYGIIPCVYIFGEGFDLPQLNGVCIAGNMNSEIRIVQYLLRPNRLDKTNPDKKSHIIIPYLDNCDDFNVNTDSFEKVRNIITRMKHYDENIEQKIKVAVSVGPSDVIAGTSGGSNNGSVIYDTEFYKKTFQENENELNVIKLKLRYSGALTCDFTMERLEYDMVKSINKSLHLDSKEEYATCAERHSEYIPNAEEYFIQKGVWTNWYDFLGVDTTLFIQTKPELIQFCKTLDIATVACYYKYCKLYNKLPKDPCEFYTTFTNISAELSLHNDDVY